VQQSRDSRVVWQFITILRLCTYKVDSRRNKIKFIVTCRITKLYEITVRFVLKWLLVGLSTLALIFICCGVARIHLTY